MTSSVMFRDVVPWAELKRVFIDISDLVYYLGSHDHLTGIQRVQASVVSEMLLIKEDVDLRFVAFSHADHEFTEISADSLSLLLADLALPADARTFEFDRAAARHGSLPGSKPLAALEEAPGTYLLLLGAAWVQTDYFRHINSLRQTLGAAFACVLHDLIPIYARETCDQNTALVFRDFLAMSRLSTDLYICVSENTCRDLYRYFREQNWERPRAAIVRHATALPSNAQSRCPEWLTKEPFVLVVSTIEGRKNHSLLFAIWRKMMQTDPTRVPKLICLGRFGWRADDFLIKYVSTDGLDRKIEVRTDVSDQELAYLYKHSLFTVYPSFYEGWGLPISESLAYGKMCVCSNTSSMPEAGGNLVSYFNPYEFDATYDTITSFINNPDLVKKAEQRIAAEFIARTWNEVAADYLATLTENIAERKQTTPLIPGSLVFRNTLTDFDGTVGPELHEKVISYLSSDLRVSSAQPCEFEAARLARGAGQWYPPEHWGCWIGMKGASVEVRSDDDDTYIVYVSYQMMPMFRDQKLRLKINGEPYFHNASYPGAYGVMVVPLKARAAVNQIEFAPQIISKEQEDASFQIDRRGLFMGIREMSILRKSDTAGRLDIMQALSGA